MYQVYQSQVYQRGTRRNPEKMLGVPELAALVYQLTGLQWALASGGHCPAVWVFSLFVVWAAIRQEMPAVAVAPPLPSPHTSSCFAGHVF